MLAAKRLPAQIEMQMIVMRRVIIGAEHRLEAFTRRRADVAQEGALIIAAVPALTNRDTPSVGENKCTNINGIGGGMFRAPSAASANDIAAGIAAHALNFDDAAAKRITRSGLKCLTRPERKRARQGAADGGDIGDRNPNAEQLYRSDSATAAAKALIGNRREARANPIKISNALLNIFVHRNRWLARHGIDRAPLWRANAGCDQNEQGKAVYAFQHDSKFTPIMVNKMQISYALDRPLKPD